MKNETGSDFELLNERSRAVFRQVVESYLEHGEPVGSRALTRALDEKISAATIRNVMQDLEFLGLLNAPHVSAGRMPTELGLRMFIDGFLEVGNIDQGQRKEIESSMDEESNLTEMLDQASTMLSGLTGAASIVLAPKLESAIKHIEFVMLSADRCLAVLVTEDGQVENRIFTPDPGLTPSALREAANFLNTTLGGRTLTEAQAVIEAQMLAHRRELDQLTTSLIENGVAIWADDDDPKARLIVRGRSNLLEDATNQDQLDRVKKLFDDLERKEDIVQFLDLTQKGEGVRIFIGSENKLFSLSTSSLVVSPYMNGDRRVIGAVGVIGPTRLNYGRIIPIVDYTAKLVSRNLR